MTTAKRLYYERPSAFSRWLQTLVLVLTGKLTNNALRAMSKGSYLIDDVELHVCAAQHVMITISQNKLTAHV